MEHSTVASVKPAKQKANLFLSCSASGNLLSLIFFSPVEVISGKTNFYSYLSKFSILACCKQLSLLKHNFNLMKYTLLSLFLFLIIYQANAQSFSVSGTVQSAADKSTFPGAAVILENPADSTTVTGAVTDFNGKFDLSVKAGKYLLKVQFIGFKTLRKAIDIQEDMQLGALEIQEDTKRLEEVVITGKIAAGIQKGDTTQFNAAAFKTLKDANTQNLVEKMPGIEMVDGKIQAQGEEVQQILIDGKPFFGNDVETALQSLPAEVVASIQVFDKKSDKAELSGFDDGERIKTINIVTKKNRRKGQFGRFTAGYGSDDRFLLGASVNFFNEDRRITVTGLSNNINALDYSADPNSQGESRTQNGIINTNSLGINYSDDWGEKIEISGSYLFSHRENEGNASLVRDYVLSDSAQVYTEDSYNTRINMDHRFNMRFDYNIDSSNRILIRPRITLNHDDNNSFFTGRTVTDNGPLNQTENTFTSNNLDYDFNNRMHYSHKFRKKGRTFTMGLHTGYYTNEDNSRRLAQNIFHRAEGRTETINQHTTRDRNAWSWETDFSYTEPVGKNGMIEFEYEVGNKLQESDKLTYNIFGNEEDMTHYSLLDTALSNTFKSGYFAQEAEIGYQYAVKKIRIQVEAEYQHARLKNDQSFPLPFGLERSFSSLLPTVRFDYKFSESKNLEFDYDTWTNAPSIGQLQAVIDNSNPLHLRTGNPNLDQTFSNRLKFRYRSNNPETERSLFVYLASTIRENTITNGVTIAENPIVLSQGVVLERGSQLSMPVNLDGYRDFRSYVSYGQPVELIKSNVNVNGSVNYTHRPGMINNEINFVNSANYRLGLGLSSNISDRVDFNISTRSSYNVVDNSLRPVLNNNYFNQSSRLNFNWIVREGFVFRTNLNHQLNSGLAESFDNSFLLLNMSLGKKFLPNDRGELSLSVYDLLKQNNNVRRNVTELYVEDSRSNVLQRYFMLSFTYNLRHFSKGTSMSDFEELHN